MPVSITFNGAAIRSLAIQASSDDLRVRANRVLSAARAKAPVDRGALRASLAVEFTRDGDTPVARIGSNLDYAIFVHEGTGIYGPRGTPIVPRNGRFLVFTPRGGGGKVFARSVRGMPGRPFLRDALDAAR